MFKCPNHDIKQEYVPSFCCYSCQSLIQIAITVKPTYKSGRKPVYNNGGQLLIITSFTLDQPARLNQSTDSETATLSTWPPNQGRSDTKSESDIDGRLSRR